MLSFVKFFYKTEISLNKNTLYIYQGYILRGNLIRRKDITMTAVSFNTSERSHGLKFLFNGDGQNNHKMNKRQYSDYNVGGVFATAAATPYAHATSSSHGAYGS